MSSLLYRIEELSGEAVMPHSADDWLTDASRDLINLLPPGCLFAVTEEEGDPNGTDGAVISSCRVVAVHKDGRPAREVSPAERAQLTDTGSLNRATALRPAFYRSAGHVYVLPGGGTVEVVSYPTVDNSSSAETIDGLPDDLNHAAVIYAARQALRSRSAAIRSELPTDLTLPTAPSPPLAPSFSYADATAATVSSTTISQLPAPPTYAKVNPSLTFTDLDGWESEEDSEMAEVAAGKLRLQMEEQVQQMQDELAETNAEVEDYRAEVERIMSQAQLDAQEAAQEAQSASEVDVQNKARALEASISEYAQELSRYQAQLQEYQAEANTLVADLQARLQRDAAEHQMVMSEIASMTAQYAEAIQSFQSQQS